MSLQLIFPHQPIRSVHHQNDEQYTVDDLAHLGCDVCREADEAQNFGQKDEKDCAPENALVIGETSENDNRENENRFGETECRRIDERNVCRKECTCNRGEACADDENKHFIHGGIVTEHRNRLLVLTNRLEHAPERRINDITRNHVHNPRGKCGENEEADV